MKLLISIFIGLLLCSNLSAQKTPLQKKNSDVAKAAVVGKKEAGRYEILVFPDNLIKLDTFTGQTYTSGFPDRGVKIWSLASVSGNGLPDESSSVKSKYRIWKQETNNRDAYPIYIYYLLNTETGQTWVSRTASKYSLLWDSFDN